MQANLEHQQPVERAAWPGVRGETQEGKWSVQQARRQRELEGGGLGTRVRGKAVHGSTRDKLELFR